MLHIGTTTKPLWEILSKKMNCCQDNEFPSSFNALFNHAHIASVETTKSKIWQILSISCIIAVKVLIRLILHCRLWVKDSEKLKPSTNYSIPTSNFQVQMQAIYGTCHEQTWRPYPKVVVGRYSNCAPPYMNQPIVSKLVSY